MVTYICVNIGSDNGLVAWRHQAITWTNVDWSSVKSSDMNIRAFSQEMPKPTITKIHLKITYLKLHSNLPGANELNIGYGITGLHCTKQIYEYLKRIYYLQQDKATIFLQLRCRHNKQARCSHHFNAFM